MFGVGKDVGIYLSCGYTDMRKGALSLALLVQDQLSQSDYGRALFVFRGKRGDRLKIIWYDGQGYCMFYKCLDQGKFTWPKEGSVGSIVITEAQLAMLLEGIDWRNPHWSSPPEYAG